jgi:glycosyltransferase involved in cell wall biosynthesis
VSVVVPVLDLEDVLADQLEALAAQSYDGDWEAILVDNGCSDRSMEVARAFFGRLPGLRVVASLSRRNLNHARNVGVSAARGDFLAFCDGDDVVAPGWLAALVEAGAENDVVGGAIEVERLNGAVRSWRDEIPLEKLAVKAGFLPAVPGGNCGMWASVANDVRFDEEFPFAGSDIEFSWRALLGSYRLAYAPKALIHQRHRRSMGKLARQWYLYGRAGPQLFRSFRDLGMPRSDHRAALRDWRRIARRAPDLVRSSGARGQWVRLAAFRLGSLAGSLRYRVLFL